MTTTEQPAVPGSRPGGVPGGPAAARTGPDGALAAGALAAGRPESGRAHRADAEGFADRDGVRLAWSRYGTQGPDVVLMPTWSIVPSRFWKAQVPYLAHHYRVTTFDGRGSGRSDRPAGAAAYSDDEYAADTLTVLDHLGIEHAVLVSLSCGASWSVRVAAAHPDRVAGLFAISPACGFPIAQPERDQHPWDQRQDAGESSGERWARYNKYRWLDGGPEEYEAFLRFFFATMFSEPHSTKQIEDAVGWGHEVDGRILADTTAGRLGCDGAICSPLEPLCHQVRCPVTVLHGTEDAIRPQAIGEQLAELTGGRLLLVEGAGHGLPSREPVLVNRELRAFIDRVTGSRVNGSRVTGSRAPAERQTWTRALRRRRRALFLSSPIGLGHARRDLAIADELRVLRPDLEIDWLAQDPVTRLLDEHRERVHPASRRLAGESAHFEDECTDHDLNAFAAVRRMDEILIHNFMVFHDLVESEHYDLVIGDEAWDVDHYLHENPELKRSAFAWLTDFVGWLPMPEGGAAEAALTADYNAEMIEHRARFPSLRDRSIFVGNPEDVVERPLGPGLPGIRDWTADNFDFAGFVTGFAPVPEDARGPLRRQLGYRDDEPVCIVTVGGSGVGASLLHRVADAVPALRRHVTDLRVVMVTGPRIDPRTVPSRPGLQVHGFLADLHRHLAACDVAVVQGGLSTCMELTAQRRPFVYVPLRRHFEQNIHVRHRLARYGAGQHLDYDRLADPEAFAATVAALLTSTVTYRPVETDGAARAAALLADLV